jgi:hypothetical protein
VKVYICGFVLEGSYETRAFDVTAFSAEADARAWATRLVRAAKDLMQVQYDALEKRREAARAVEEAAGNEDIVDLASSFDSLTVVIKQMPVDEGPFDGDASLVYAVEIEDYGDALP